MVELVNISTILRYQPFLDEPVRPSPAALVALSFAPHCGLEIEQKPLGSREVPGSWQLKLDIPNNHGGVIGDII
jgi:hypothetical protein